MSLFSAPLALTGDTPQSVVPWASVLNSDPSVVSVTGAYTAKANDFAVLCDTTSAAFSVTLPPAAENKGKILYIQRTTAGANAATIDPNGSETINGSATVSLGSQYSSRLLISTGAAWAVIASV